MLSHDQRYVNGVHHPVMLKSHTVLSTCGTHARFALDAAGVFPSNAKPLERMHLSERMAASHRRDEDDDEHEALRGEDGLPGQLGPRRSGECIHAARPRPNHASETSSG